jgi:hypothetical protein
LILCRWGGAVEDRRCGCPCLICGIMLLLVLLSLTRDGVLDACRLNFGDGVLDLVFWGRRPCLCVCDCDGSGACSLLILGGVLWGVLVLVLVLGGVLDAILLQ